MKEIEGQVLSLNRKPLWCATNIWKVCYKVKIGRKTETREKFVAGINACDGNVSQMEAALSVAAVYGGKAITIISSEFVGTGVKAGLDWELQKRYWNSLGC